MTFQPTAGSAETKPPPPGQSASTESLMAGLSDEQVRQMLISELQQDAMEDQYAREQQQMVGPAGLLYRLLQKISGGHDSSEKQFRILWSGIPQVIPDLHKVFLNL